MRESRGRAASIPQRPAQRSTIGDHMNRPKNNQQQTRAGKSRPSRHRTLSAPLLACTALVAAAPAQADESWTGANGTDWFDADNWSSGVPGITDTIFIDPADARPVVLSGGPAQSAAHIYVGFVNDGELTIRDGATLTNSGNAGIGFLGADGIVTVTGQGTQWTILGGLMISAQSNGTLRVLDGAKVSANSAIVGFNGNSIAGTLLVDGNGSTFSTGTGGDLTIAEAGVGRTMVRNGATLDVGGKIVIGNAPNSAGSLVIGGKDGNGVVQAAGTIKAAGGIHFGDGPSGFPNLTIQHSGTDYLFDTDLISDPGGKAYFNHFAGTTTYTGDGTGFTGITTIYQSRLNVNSSLYGSTSVFDGGILGGTGTLENVSLNSGTIAPGLTTPGQTIGTLTATGTYLAFYDGSTYEVDVNAASQSDRIKAKQLNIDGGTIKVLAGAGSYAPTQTYTILTSVDDIYRSADFNVSSNLAFLTPSLTYDTKKVDLTLTRNAASFASVGLTPNQIAAAGGVDSLDAGNPVQGAVLGLSAEQARDAFDQLSGEIHGSAKTGLVEDSRFLRNAVNDHMRAASGEEGPSVWGQAFGSRGHWSGDGNAARLSRSTGGFFAGADAPAFDTWRFGAAAGYSRSSFDAKDRHSSGSSDNYHVALYGGATWDALSLRTGAAYTLHDVSTKRIAAFPGLSDTFEGDYRAGTAQVFGELGYGVNAGAAVFEPFANLAHVSHHTGGFTEKGGAAALSAGGGTANATFTTLGLRASTGFTLGGVEATARGMIGWRHAYGDTAALSSLRFAGSNAFTVAGVPLARDTATVEAGLDFALSPTAVLGVAYGGQFGSGQSDQSLKANINVRF